MLLFWSQLRETVAVLLAPDSLTFLQGQARKAGPINGTQGNSRQGFIMQMIQDTHHDANRRDLKLLHGQSVTLKLNRGAVLVVSAGRVTVTRRIWLDNAALTLRTPCARGGIYEATTPEWVDVHAEQGATVWVASVATVAATRPGLEFRRSFWRNGRLDLWFTIIVVKFRKKMNLGVNFS
jgi:hypothetical protein